MQQLAPGQAVSEYLIIQALDRDAFGETWLARDVRLDRNVSLRLFFSRSNVFKTTVNQLARSWGGLYDQHVCSIYNVFVVNDNLFVVSEHVEGKTLRQMARDRINGHLAFDEVVHIGIEIANGISYIKTRNIYSIDLRPEAIICCAASPRLKLCFGIRDAVYADPDLRLSYPDVSLEEMAPEIMNFSPPGRAIKRLLFGAHAL